MVIRGMYLNLFKELLLVDVKKVFKYKDFYFCVHRPVKKYERSQLETHGWSVSEYTTGLSVPLGMYASTPMKAEAIARRVLDKRIAERSYKEFKEMVLMYKQINFFEARE
jgi:hypothetical protein